MAPLCTLKLILIGESGVGKTCLLVRFVDRLFKVLSKPTIIDLKVRTIEINGNLVKLEIWDTAGQERFKSVTQEYYRKADGVILMYDVTDIETYYKTSTWLSEIREHTDGIVVIVGNKIEDSAAQTVQSSVVQRFARDEGLEFIETSAKTGYNVDQVFKILVGKIMEKKYPSLIVPNRNSEISNLPQVEVTPKIDDVIKLSKKRKKEKKQGCC